MTTAADYKAKGNAAFKSANYKDAITWYTKALELDKTEETLYSNRAAAYSSIGDHKAALADADKTIELKPKWVKGYFRKGMALHKLGRFEEAVEAFTKALEVSGSDNPDVQQWLNDSRACLRAENAKKSYKTETNPAEAKRLGNNQFKEGNYTEAINWYSRAIELASSGGPNEELATYYSNRAACYSQTHSHKEVVADCTEAIKINPNMSKAFLRRAIAHEGLEKWQKAADDYKRVMELEPGASNASAGYSRCQKFAKETF